jgi:hypothetical protein
MGGGERRDWKAVLGRRETKNVTVTTCVTGAFIGYINRLIEIDSVLSSAINQ